ncbi:hypothetical protein BGZ98_008590 [Dissophora globulifera]|nr:hypothetical protein BGZ98_008590 [Dissophora globulifera]
MAVVHQATQRKVKHIRRKIVKKKKQHKPKEDDNDQKRKLSPGTKKATQVSLTVGSIKHRMTETGAASQPTRVTHSEVVSQTKVVALENPLKWTMEELNLLQMHAY